MKLLVGCQGMLGVVVPQQLGSHRLETIALNYSPFFASFGISQMSTLDDMAKCDQSTDRNSCHRDIIVGMGLE